MKPAALLLVGSLALNALLLAYGWHGRGADEAPGRTVGAADSSRRDADPLPTTATTPASLAALPPAALRAALLRENLPREVVDAIVAARIFRPFETRRRELFVQTLALPWWQTAAAGSSRLSLLTPEQRRQLRTLEAGARNETLRLLGPQALDPDGAIALRHAFVSPEKAVLLDGLLRDYRDLDESLRDETLGLRTAADREREALLERERQRDLAQLLTPAELEQFELRTSRFAPALQLRWLGFQPTEAEYRALVAAHESFAARHPPTSTADHAAQSYRLAQTPEFAEELRTLLGDARAAEWKKSGQAHFRTLENLGLETGLPADTLRQLGMLLSDTAARSWEVYLNSDRTADQKRAALAGLAANARAELTARLGAAVTERFLREHATWLDAIAHGTAIELRENGYSHAPVGRPPPRRR